MVSKLINTKAQHEYHCYFACNDPTVALQVYALHAAIKPELYEIGETLLYKKDGRTSLVKLVSIKFDDNNALRLTCRTSAGEKIITGMDFPFTPPQSTIPPAKAGALSIMEARNRHMQRMEKRKLVSNQIVEDVMDIKIMGKQICKDLLEQGHILIPVATNQFSGFGPSLQWFYFGTNTHPPPLHLSSPLPNIIQRQCFIQQIPLVAHQTSCSGQVTHMN